MLFLKWGFICAAIFVIAVMVILTILQAPFQQTVSTNLLFFRTAAYPVYYYLAAAFGSGLAVGLCITGYYYISLSMKIRRLKHEIASERTVRKAEFTTLTDTAHTAPGETIGLPLDPGAGQQREQSVDTEGRNR